MIDRCPTCHRRSILCRSCGVTAVDDQAGELPLWCPSCGATLRTAPEEREPHEDIEHVVMQLRTASAEVEPRHAVLMMVAVVFGLLAAAYTIWYRAAG